MDHKNKLNGRFGSYKGHTRDDQRPICRNRKYFPGVKLFTRGVSDLKLQYDLKWRMQKKENMTTG